ncbi:hypothetical protein KC363_g8986 [Hortaea werneckii]|nr:hypothetical protein KC363_g8986 [Hortaea werneckii]
MSKHPLRLMSDTSSASLSPAVQTLQRSIRADLHHDHHHRQQWHLARETGSDDAASLRVLEIATTKATKTRPADRSRGTARSGRATPNSSVSSTRGDGGRRRGPRRVGKATASTSTTTGGSGDGGMGISGSSLVDVETRPRGEGSGTRRLGEVGRGGLEWRGDSPPTNRTRVVHTTATGVAAASPGNDDDDDDDEEEEESWDLLATPPSPSTTDPKLSVSGNGDDRPDPLIPLHRNRNPSPSSRPVTVSTSSSDGNWMTGFLQYQNSEQEEEAEGEDDSSSFSLANESEKKQYPSARGGSFGRSSRVFSSASASSPREHQREQQAHQRPGFAQGGYSPRASGRVCEAVQECAIPRGTGPQTRDDEGVWVESRWGVGLSGVRDEDGWGGVGRGGGIGEGRDEGDEAEDEEWEMV